MSSDNDDDDDDDSNKGDGAERRGDEAAHKGPSEQLEWLWLTSACLSEGAQGLEIVAPPRPPSSLSSQHKFLDRGTAARPQHSCCGTNQPSSNGFYGNSGTACDRGVADKYEDGTRVHYDSDDIGNNSYNEFHEPEDLIGAAAGSAKRKPCATHGLAGSWSGAFDGYGLVEDSEDNDDNDDHGGDDAGVGNGDGADISRKRLKRSKSAPPLTSPKSCSHPSASAPTVAPQEDEPRVW
jgi:hypothetical protein